MFSHLPGAWRALSRDLSLATARGGEEDGKVSRGGSGVRS